jgi:hypothetical protein
MLRVQVLGFRTKIILTLSYRFVFNHLCFRVGLKVLDL